MNDLNALIKKYRADFSAHKIKNTSFINGCVNLKTSGFYDFTPKKTISKSQYYIVPLMRTPSENLRSSQSLCILTTIRLPGFL